MANSAPREILEQICSQLPLDTLKNVGLFCRTFKHAADTFMFREVMLLPNDESFRQLRHISKNPRLREYVKRVVFVGKMSPRYKDYDDWHRHLIRGTSVPTADDYEWTKVMDFQHFDKEELEQHYARYCSWVQCEFRGHSDYVARTHEMCEAFARLPNLASVTLARRFEWRKRPGRRIERESLVKFRALDSTTLDGRLFENLVRVAHRLVRRKNMGLDGTKSSRVAYL